MYCTWVAVAEEDFLLGVNVYPVVQGEINSVWFLYCFWLLQSFLSNLYQTIYSYVVVMDISLRGSVVCLCSHEAKEEIEELSETFSGFSDKEYPFGYAI